MKHTEKPAVEPEPSWEELPRQKGSLQLRLREMLSEMRSQMDLGRRVEPFRRKWLNLRHLANVELILK